MYLVWAVGLCLVAVGGTMVIVAHPLSWLNPNVFNVEAVEDMGSSGWWMLAIGVPLCLVSVWWQVGIAAACASYLIAGWWRMANDYPWLPRFDFAVAVIWWPAVVQFGIGRRY